MVFANIDRNFASGSVNLPAADGIRGFACIIVLVTHAITMFFPKTAPWLAGTGKIGVWLFFVLSAFLLTRKFIVHGLNNRTFVQYVFGRFFRIIPLFAISLVFYRLAGTAGLNYWSDVASALLFQKGYAHLWTVPVEFVFYFYLPILFGILLLSLKYYGVQLSLLLIVAMLFVHQLIWPYGVTPINTINVNYYLPTFVFGVLLAFVPMQKLKISVVLSFIGSMTFVIVLLISTPGARLFLFGTPLDFRLSTWFVYYGAFWAIFIAFALTDSAFLGVFFTTPVMRLIGSWSFSIYLFHWFFYVKIIEFWPGNFFAMVVGMVSAILFGAIVYYVIESPLDRFRKNILRNLNGVRS